MYAVRASLSSRHEVDGWDYVGPHTDTLVYHFLNLCVELPSPQWGGLRSWIVPQLEIYPLFAFACTSPHKMFDRLKDRIRRHRHKNGQQVSYINTLDRIDPGFKLREMQ